jgi:probable traG protein, N-terminal part
MEYNQKKIGNKIKKRRKELGISQKELAKKTNISPAIMSQHENGDVAISLSKLIEIANILDLTPNFLLDFKEKSEVNNSMSINSIIDKIVKLKRNTRVNLETGVDKAENLFIPLLKNCIEDIVILDIDGKTYYETYKYRENLLNSKIHKIDLLSYNSLAFNPFHYVNSENFECNVKMILELYLGEKLTEKKEKFLFDIISNLFFDNYKLDFHFKLTFPMIYDYIISLGEIKNKEKNDLKNEILKDFELFSDENIRRNTVKNDFELNREKNQKDLKGYISNTYYFIVKEENFEKLAPLIRIFFNFVILENTKEMDFLIKGIPNNKLIMIYDKFDKLGKQAMLEKATGYIMGYGINCVFVANIDELKKIYEERNGILSNSNVIKISKKKIDYIYLKHTNNFLKNSILIKETAFIDNGTVLLGEEGQKELELIDKF